MNISDYAAVPEGASVSLYLHIPFCSQLCWYCGCHTKITRRYEPVAHYLKLLKTEIALVLRSMPDHHVVRSIHFGGGSPGLLEASDFVALMAELQHHFSLSSFCEVSLELDPRGITEEKSAAYAKCGVNRVSLGVQDFDDTVLRSVNREKPFALTRDAFALLRRYGITQINMDLMYGLPHQTLQTAMQTMERVAELRPSRIAYFGYAHVPWFKKHMRLVEEEALPGKELRFDMAQFGAKKLQDAGYKAIGIDHYALPEDDMVAAQKEGRLNRNFQGYTTDDCQTLVGLGVSSISRLPNSYIQNAVDMPVYEKSIKAGQWPIRKFCSITAQDHLHGAIIERLMCDLCVNLEEVCARFDVAEDSLDHCLDALYPFEQDGLVHISSDRTITIKPEAWIITRLVASAFDMYLNPQTEVPKRHARAI